MVTSKYFSEGEFNRCSPSCSLQDMKQTTMSKLDTAREIAGIPFVLTSAYRSPAHDRGKTQRNDRRLIQFTDQQQKQFVMQAVYLLIVIIIVIKL